MGVEIKDGDRDESKNPGKRNPNRGSADSRSNGKNRLALLQQLEASLAHSHRALITLDLAAIQQGTRDQLTLCRNLAVEIRQSHVAEGRDATESSQLSQELRRSEWNVLQAARLQAALLKRAQRKLVVIENMLAGAERNYASRMQPMVGPPLSRAASNRV